MQNVPFVQLQALLAVSRSQSFTRAARDLGVSRSAISQSIRQLEQQLHVVLVQRTTRSVALTDVGRQLVENVGPALAHTEAALTTASAKPGEVVGRLRLSIPRSAIPLILEPVMPRLRAKHPRVEVEIVVDDHFVDIVAGGFDAGVRLSESIERDMVQVRLTNAFRFVVVASPAYLDRRGRPERPEDLLDHECIGLRRSDGTLYAWELERGRKSWRLPVRGGVIANEGAACVAMARLGLGLAYTLEPAVTNEVRRGDLEIVLDAYAAEVPGFFLYYPSRAQRSMPLQVFVETAKQVLLGKKR